ncbi:hypothetical protein AAC387_Pa04g2167 [Persea americana]
MIAFQSNPRSRTIAFQSNPRSRTADLEGLGTISMQLTMALVKKTEAHIKWLMESGWFDGYDRDCLDVCWELYMDLKSTEIPSKRWRRRATAMPMYG